MSNDAAAPKEGQDAPATEGDNAPTHNYKKYVTTYLDVLFKSDYDRTEAFYVLIAAIIIAINTGFVNGVSMSPLFLSESDSVKDSDVSVNPNTQGISGTGGSFTKSARFLVENDWPNYEYATFLILSYIFGSFLCGFITPRAHKNILEPTYGPTFFIAALFLLGSSLFATYGLPSRFIFYFATAALGVQNGIASIYSANLIRPTLTGASTDLGLITAECLRGNFERFIRGTLIAIIVINYWIGGIIAVPIVKALNQRSMYISVGFYVLLGLLCLLYTVRELGVSVWDAFIGKWDYKDVLESLFEDDGVQHTVEDFMHLFDLLDLDNDKVIEAEELAKAIEKSKKITMTTFRMKALMRAADANHDNCIDREEWLKLARKVVNTDEQHA